MDLPRRESGCPFADEGEEEPSRPFAGAGEEDRAGLGKGVTAARPLDGDALTRWGARTPARGSAAVPWTPPLALVRSVVLGREERAR